MEIKSLIDDRANGFDVIFGQLSQGSEQLVQIHDDWDNDVRFS